MPLEHARAPVTPFMDPRTTHPPGIAPLDPSDWIRIDETYDDQIALRDKLLAEWRDVVLVGDGSAAAGECLEQVLAALDGRDGFAISADQVTRPDGVSVPLDRAAPLATMGRLVQEDVLILEKPEGSAEHVLTGGVLCFPSRWSLAEKYGRPLLGVHARVPDYAGGLAPRVQRLFDTLRAGRPLWRANWLVHGSPDLFQPVDEAAKFEFQRRPTGRYWLRVERQCIVPLPQTHAAAFTVKTMVTPVEALSAAERTRLLAALGEQSTAMQDYHGGSDYHDKARAYIEAIDA